MGEKRIEISPPSAYLKNCVEEVAQSVYGRDNRKPIHDVIEYMVDSAVAMGRWADDLGLTVVDGKLCVIYDPDGGSSDSHDAPQEIREALEGILTDPYMSQVRYDIVTAFLWAATTIAEAATIESSLGLTVIDGQLYAVISDDEEGYDIPTEIMEALDRINSDVNGKQLREDIVTVLRWGLSNDFAGYIEDASDIGLTVVDGKLCVEYYEEE